MLLGSAFGFGAQDYRTGLAADFLERQFNLVGKLNDYSFCASWFDIIKIKKHCDKNDIKLRNNFFDVLGNVKNLRLAVIRLLNSIDSGFPVVLGGDHSCAIATWSAIAEFYGSANEYGLIWIDAHLDSHTITTSHSGAYHGMPISFLLGTNSYFFNLSEIHKFNPENIVIIGARSYEDEEIEYLKSKNVKIYFIDEVKKRGIKDVFTEALKKVKCNTKNFGVSFDLDSIDPIDAPGVGSPVSNGIRWNEIKNNLSILFSDNSFNALEIVELNHFLDVDNRTAQILLDILLQLAENKLGKISYNI